MAGTSRSKPSIQCVDVQGQFFSLIQGNIFKPHNCCLTPNSLINKHHKPETLGVDDSFNLQAYRFVRIPSFQKRQITYSIWAQVDTVNGKH